MFLYIKNTFNKVKKTSIDTYKNLSKKVSDTISDNKNKVIGILTGTIIGFSSPLQAKANDLAIDSIVEKDLPTKTIKNKLNQNSIVDSLKILGVKSDFKTRSIIYKNNFSDIYRGTYNQNTKLLELVKKDSTKAKVEKIIIGDSKKEVKLNNKIEKEQVDNTDIQDKEGYNDIDIIDKWKKSAGFKKYNSLLKADKIEAAERFKKETILKLSDKVYKDLSTTSIIKNLIKSKFILKKDIMDKQKQIENSWNKSNESKDFEKLLMENKLEEAKKLKTETIKKITKEKILIEKNNIPKYKSVVQLLDTLGLDSTFESRELYFEDMNKNNSYITYKGTSSQNIKLVKHLTKIFKKDLIEINKNKIEKKLKDVKIGTISQSTDKKLKKVISSKEIDYLKEDNGLKILAEYDFSKKEPKKQDKVEFSEVKGIRSGDIYANSSIGYKDNNGKVEITPSEDSFKLNAVLEEKDKYKLSLSIVHEINEISKDDTILEASYKMLYAGSKLGTYIGVTKGSNIEKFVIAQGFAIEGHKIKLSAALLNKLMTFNYGDFGDKDVNLKQKAYGIDYSKSINNNSILNEIKSSIVYFDSDGKELGVIGDIIVDTDTEYDWTEVSGGVRGGSKLLAEFTAVLKLNEKLRLDLTAGYDKTKWNKMYETLAKEESGNRYGAELKYRLNDHHQFSTGYKGSDNGIKTSSVKYDYDHGNNLSSFVEAEHLKNIGGQEDENKYKFGLKYTWGGDNRKSKLSSLYTSPNNSNNLTFSDLEPNSNVNTNDIQVYEKVIWENHIVYIDKTKLGGDSNIETNPDGTLKAINLDTGANNLVAVDTADDTAYLPFLSIKDSHFLRIENFKALNTLMASQGLKTGDKKVLKIEISDSAGTNTLFELTLEKGSVEFKVSPAKAHLQHQDVANAYIGGSIVKKILEGIFADPSSDKYLEPDTAREIINGTISSEIIDKYIDGTLSGKVLNGVTDGKFTDDQKTSLGDGTLSNEDAEAIADGLDTTPDAFTFTDLINQTTSTPIESNTITVEGIETSTSISIVDGEYSINGEAWTSNPGTVNADDIVKVRHTTSGSFSTPTNSTLTIGGVSDIFTTTTEAIDTLPNTFTFVDITGQTISTEVTSAPVTITGINSGSAISITAGEYQINGGAWTSVAGTINEGDILTVKHTTSADYEATTNTVVNIDTLSDTFSSTTGIDPVDISPDSFTITDQAGLNLSSLAESNPITVAGVNSATPISITGGKYSISTDNGTSWSTYTTSAGNVNNGDKVKIQLTTSASYSTTTQATLNIGGVTDIFDAATKALVIVNDPVPNQFSITDQSNLNLNSLIESSPITITGINIASAISINNGKYSISTDNGSTWSAFTNSNGTVNNDDKVKIQLTTSGSYSTTVQATLDVGGITDIFDVATKAAPAANDSTPDNFTFTDQTNINLNSLTESAAITVADIDVASVISISGGEYSIDGGTTWTSANGTVNNGDTVKVRIQSSASYSTTVQATLNIGTVTDVFDVTTKDEPQTVPTMGDVPNQTFTNGVAITNINIADYVTLTESDAISAYTLTGTLPTGLSFNSTTGVLSGTATQTGTFNLSITATDNDGESNSDNFSITVEAPADSIAPDKTSESITNLDTQGATFSGSVSFDENVDTINSITIANGGSIQVDSGVGTSTINISGVAPNADSTQITINISDAAGNSRTITTAEYDLFGTAPSMGNIPNQTFTNGVAITNINVADYVTLTELDAISAYTLTGTLPTGLSFNSTTGVLSGTATQTGTFNLSITATDNDGESNSDNFSITVEAPADSIAPDKTSESITNLDTQGATFSGSVSFDENVDTINSITIANGGSIQVDSGVGTSTINISGVAPNADSTQITINISDAAGNSRTITTAEYDLF